jgi:hypothetical protein
VYRDFWLNDSYSIRDSPTEKTRFGIDVYRCDVPVGSSILDSEIVSICEDSKADLMILRAPSTRVKLGALLSQSKYKKAFQADTLVYYELDTSIFKTPLMTAGKVTLLQSTDLNRIQQFESLINQTFHDYSNHYSANPRLESLNVADGYLEWTLGLLTKPKCATFIHCTNSEYIDGWITIEEDVDYVEMVIGGTDPRARGTGAYMRMVYAIVNHSLDIRKRYIRVSTQITNSDVMRVWHKNGFRFSGSINTFHIEKKNMAEGGGFEPPRGLHP